MSLIAFNFLAVLFIASTLADHDYSGTFSYVSTSDGTISLTFNTDHATNMVELMFTGPIDRWFGFIIGGTGVMDGGYGIVVDTDGVYELALTSFGTANSMITTGTDFLCGNTTVTDTTQTVECSRSLVVSATAAYSFAFGTAGADVDVAMGAAIGAAATFIGVQHAAALGGQTVTLMADPDTDGAVGLYSKHTLFSAVCVSIATVLLSAVYCV